MVTICCWIIVVFDGTCDGIILSAVLQVKIYKGEILKFINSAVLLSVLQNSLACISVGVSSGTVYPF